MESKQDVGILMNKVMQKKKNKADFFSDSEDEMCTIRDDMEEYSIQNQKNSIFLQSP